MEAYATTKETTVPTMRGAVSTPPPSGVLEFVQAGAGECGNARKKERRVAATRSRSRMSPVDMVAPDREKPGKSSARIWEEPTSMASLKVVSSSPRLSRPIWSAAHMRPLPTISDAGHDPERGERTLDERLGRQSDDDDGMVA